MPLADLTRWRIGGPAPALARASSQRELRALLAELGSVRVLVLGLGANLLVADDGPGAPVVILDGEFKQFELGDESIRFGAGAPISGVVQAARRGARSGLWILEAVPGTMGGALRMNAGTAEEGIWDRTAWVEAMGADGQLRRLTRNDVRPHYRGIELVADVIFLRGELQAPPGDAKQIDQEHRHRRDAKLASQVYDKPTCGSTWKNPDAPAPPAWKLVDRVGMRGARRGDAQISEKHANFIVNLGQARARDVVDLMIETRRRVRAETGIALEPEIRFWGFAAGVLEELGVK